MIKDYLKKFLSFLFILNFILISSIFPVQASTGRLSPQNFEHMYYFAAQGRTDVLLDAINRGLNIDAVNQNGDTGLCLAVKRRNPKAFNTFVAAGANTNHPCTQRIPYYANFIRSKEVNLAQSQYSQPVYYTKKEDNTWKIAGLILALGGGAALLLSGGGGGGSESTTETPEETPGLTCEYGCAQYDENNKCIVCNEAPSDPCEENPCSEGCYTNLECSGDSVCVSVNSCGGCEKCQVIEEAETNFVIESETAVDNGENLVNSGENKSGTWGGIYSKQKSINNTGDIILSTGNYGVGIMSTKEADISNSLSGSISTAGNNIINTGNIIITADKSYGIFSGALGTISGSNLSSLNSLQNGGTIYTNGTNNTGIYLMGNGKLSNSGNINMEGDATATTLDATYIPGLSSDIYSAYLIPSQLNSAIYFTTGTAGQRTYTISSNLNNTLQNSGNINITLSSNDQLQTDWSQGKSISVTGFGSVISPQSANDTFTVSNVGNIEIGFNFDENFFADINSEQQATARQNYFVSGLSVINPDFSFNGTDYPSTITENRGKISISGNGYMHGIIAAGTELNNYGDILIDMNSQYYSNTASNFISIGISARDSIINQYADIDYQISGVGGDFYSVGLYNSILNIDSKATLNGNIGAHSSTINNSGSIIGNYADMATSELNNLQNAQFDIDSAVIMTTNNSGTLNIGTLEGNENGTYEFNNLSGGTAEVDSIGGQNSVIDEDSVNSFFQSVNNAGTLRTNNIRTVNFNNSGVINTDKLSYYSYNPDGTVNLQNIQFDNLQNLTNTSDGSLLKLASRYRDTFILGDIAITQNAANSSVFGGGTAVLYSDWFNSDAAATNYSFLQLGNIDINMSNISQTDSLLTGVQIDRDYVNIISDNNFNISTPGNITGFALDGISNNLTNNGTISITGKQNLGNTADGSLELKGIFMNGKGSSFINNGGISISNTRTEFTGEGENFIYGIDASAGNITLNAESSITLSAQSHYVNVYGLNLHGDVSGTNSGKITVSTVDGGVGVYAAQTGENGFENKGEIEVNSANGIGMYADGYVDGTNDRYVKLINSGSITVNGSNGTGIYASGSQSEILNTGTIKVDGTGNNIILENGAQILNQGTLSSSAAIDIDALTGNNGKLISGKNSVLQASQISGTLYAGADITQGNNQDSYIANQAVVSQDNQAKLVSQSVMFNAKFTDNEDGGQNIVMDRKRFDELVEDKTLAQYLENNYQNSNGVKYFDTLKTAQDEKTLNNQVSSMVGEDVIPAFAYQDIERLRNINRTMSDLVTGSDNNKEERISVISNNYYKDTGSVNQVSGWEESLYGISGLFDKKINSDLRYGVGISIYRAIAEFDNGAKRTDNLFEIYTPYWFESQNLGILIMPYAGYSDGDYERYDNSKKHKADINSWYYGINNRVYGKYNLGSLRIEPRIELNINGVSTDRIEEKEGIATDSRDLLSTEAGVGLYAEKKIDLTEGSLDISGGAMYYYELNNNVYKDIDATLYDMEGNYLLHGYNNRRSRGLISLNAEYNIKGWSIYGNIMRMLERDDNMIYNAGIRYSF